MVLRVSRRPKMKLALYTVTGMREVAMGKRSGWWCLLGGQTIREFMPTFPI